MTDEAARRGHDTTQPARLADSCSFCGKSKNDVARIVATPSVGICDECVELCNDVLEREVKPVDESISLEPPVRCSLCQLAKPAGDLLPIGDVACLCATCLDAVRVVLDTAR